MCRIIKFRSDIPTEKACQLDIVQWLLPKEMAKVEFIRVLKAKSLNQLE